jgi:hypothetical protein
MGGIPANDVLYIVNEMTKINDAIAARVGRSCDLSKLSSQASFQLYSLSSGMNIHPIASK